MENNHLLRLYVLCFVMAMFCGCGNNNAADQKNTDIYPKIAFAGDSLLSALLGAPMPAYYIGMSRDSFDVLRLEDKNGTIDIGGRLFSYEGKFLRDSLRALELNHQYRWYFNPSHKQDVWCDSALWYSVMNHLESIIGGADYYKLSKFYKKKTSRDTAYYAFWDFVSTAKRFATLFKNEMCFSPPKTKCDLNSNLSAKKQHLRHKKLAQKHHKKSLENNHFRGSFFRLKTCVFQGIFVPLYLLS